MAGKPETALQTAIVDALERIGVWVMVMNVTKRRGKRGVNCGEPGMPDLWTDFGWIEVKLPDEGVVSQAQKVWHAKAKGRGIRVATVDSVSDAVAVVQAWAIGDRAKLR